MKLFFKVIQSYKDYEYDKKSLAKKDGDDLMTNVNAQNRENHNANKIDALRHAEYYDMQPIYDDLYKRSQSNEVFTDLMEYIVSAENILLAYRNIKTNTGSNTAGTDGKTIKDIGTCTADEVVQKVRFILTGSVHGYRPKPIRRKEIPKPNGNTRPLGIPCIWDRLIQQCIKQVLEPICEAKFSKHSYGFRPDRSVENAMAEIYQRMQISHLHYVIEFDIKGFFDNVNHSKLIKQIWTLGIRDTKLINIIKRMLQAPIKMPDGTISLPAKGTPQGGILSPLLANIVLNELDKWVESQWESNPIVYKYKAQTQKNGTPNYGYSYTCMRATKLKEMYIIRYADDFRILCRTEDAANRTRIAVEKWLKERLKLDISPEKTKVINVTQKYTEFLGFKIRLRKKGTKQVVESRMSDKALVNEKENLVKAMQAIYKAQEASPQIAKMIVSYNAKVIGIQNYYQIATDISKDMAELQRAVQNVMNGRLRHQIRKNGRMLTEYESKRYGKSKMMRYEVSSREPIYPIGYLKTRNPMFIRIDVNRYTENGRKNIHDNLQLQNKNLMLKLMKSSSEHMRSIEYLDNRISLYAAQSGKCLISGIIFEDVKDIHCHHVLPLSMGGGDNYQNLILVLEPIHKLIHATEDETIQKYLTLIPKLSKAGLAKLNHYRQMANNKELKLV